MRSSNQTFYVGPKTTVVGCRAEIEGEGRSVVIGDDCMFSDEINIRNYDMHTVFDVESGAILNRPPKDLVIDKHVWIGYRALILAPERIGRGSIVGASSLANKPIEPFSLAVGAPAKIAKRGVSWSRPVNHVEPRDLQFAREESARLS
ncbi:acyltransferase [Methylocystis parvus]|uniref:acyltransferase n=1 Tax=Methylocystis parvus TaxID=134 RepID=UPI003C78F4DC